MASSEFRKRQQEGTRAVEKRRRTRSRRVVQVSPRIVHWHPTDLNAWIGQCVDAHCAGEPARVVVGGVPDMPGDTVFAKIIGSSFAIRWRRRHFFGSESPLKKDNLRLFSMPLFVCVW